MSKKNKIDSTALISDIFKFSTNFLNQRLSKLEQSDTNTLKSISDLKNQIKELSISLNSLNSDLFFSPKNKNDEKYEKFPLLLHQFISEKYKPIKSPQKSPEKPEIEIHMENNDEKTIKNSTSFKNFNYLVGEIKPNSARITSSHSSNNSDLIKNCLNPNTKLENKKKTTKKTAEPLEKLKKALGKTTTDNNNIEEIEKNSLDEEKSKISQKNINFKKNELYKHYFTTPSNEKKMSELLRGREIELKSERKIKTKEKNTKSIKELENEAKIKQNQKIQQLKNKLSEKCFEIQEEETKNEGQENKNKISPKSKIVSASCDVRSKSPSSRFLNYYYFFDGKQNNQQMS